MFEVTRTTPSSLIADARAQYNLVSGREMFLDQFASTPEAQAYFTDEELSLMHEGTAPPGWEVHHMQPLFRGGDNSYDNLILVPKQWHADNFFDLHFYPEGATTHLERIDMATLEESFVRLTTLPKFRADRPATDEEIRRIQTELSLRLPDEYLQFLEAFWLRALVWSRNLRHPPCQSCHWGTVDYSRLR